MNVPLDDESNDFSDDSLEAIRRVIGSGSSSNEELELLADEIFVHGLLRCDQERDQ